MKYLLLLLPLIALADVQTSLYPIPYLLEEMRYCGEPARYADGTIKRSAAMISAFKRNHPCPTTGLTYGPCLGWSVMHSGSRIRSNQALIPTTKTDGSGRFTVIRL